MTAPDGGIELAIDISVIVVALLALLFVARLIRRVVKRYIDRVPNLSKLLQAFLVGLVYWLVLAFGLMIMINRPFDEGDYVDIGGVAGTVKAVSIVATTVTTPDNQVIVIPNKNVCGNIITNVTTSETRRVDLTFGIGYDDDIEQAQRVLEGVVTVHPAVLKDPAPTIRVSASGASSVDFIVRPWANTVDYWGVYWDLTRQVKEAFDAAGISIPFPQQDMHIKQLAAGPTTFAQQPDPGTPTAAGSAPMPDDAASATARGASDVVS